MKKTILTFIVLIMTMIAVYAFHFRSNESQLIIGTWVAEGETLSSRWVFDANGKCTKYDDNEVYGVYNYQFSTTTPQCGIDVDTGPDDKYLKFENVENRRDESCFLLDFIDGGKLSIIFLGVSSYEPTLFLKQ